MKMCIICHQEKSEFSDEHVFPACIGGAFVIRNVVCKECNKKMGDNIDTPFSQLKEILVIRNLHDLRRDNRSIKHPFKSREYMYNGKPYIILRNEQGFLAGQKPNLEITEKDGGFLINIHMSKMFYKSDEQIIKMFADEVKERTGLDLNADMIINKRETEQEAVTIKESDFNNPWIFEFLKVSYEAGVTFVHKYIDDDMAMIYSKMLTEGEFDRNYAQYFNPQGEITAIAYQRIKEKTFLWQYPSFVVIMTLPSYGLVSAVRIFDFFYVMILSPKETYLDERIIYLVNDIIENNFYAGFLKLPIAFNFSFDTTLFSEVQLDELKKGNLITSFVSDNGKIPVYDLQQELLTDNADGLQIDFYSKQKFLSTPKLLSTASKWKHDFSNMNLFLKSNQSGIFYKIKEMDFIYQLL
jgi:hypothetical protein